MVAGVSTLGIVLPSATAAAMAARRERAGSASAVLGILQSTSGVLASTAASLLANGTVGPMALVMLACGAVAFVLVRVESASSREEAAPVRGALRASARSLTDGGAAPMCAFPARERARPGGGRGA